MKTKLTVFLTILFASMSFVHQTIPMAGPIKISKITRADINTPDSNGFTPLMRAVQTGNLAQVKDFIKQGANVNYSTASGMTPLMLAAKQIDNHNTEKIVKLLLDKGAEIDVPDSVGSTALVYAIVAKNMNIIRTLLASQASAHTIDRFGKTPIDVAREVRPDLAKKLERWEVVHTWE
jgi:ankyrin repeat protein